jgi:hypothetical protein
VVCTGRAYDVVVPSFGVSAAFPLNCKEEVQIIASELDAVFFYLFRFIPLILLC